MQANNPSTVTGWVAWAPPDEGGGTDVTDPAGRASTESPETITSRARGSTEGPDTVAARPPADMATGAGLPGDAPMGSLEPVTAVAPCREEDERPARPHQRA